MVRVKLDFARLEMAKIAGSEAEGTALPCAAWKHFAGGEISAVRPGVTWVMFLAVFNAPNPVGNSYHDNSQSW